MNSHMEQQALRVTSLVEDFHPVLRRRAFTSIRSSFPTFFTPQAQTTVLSMNESQRLIQQNFSKINNIIDLVDDHIRRRIECYQNQVVSVVQNEIQQMRQQTNKVVTQFNSMIQEKNKQNQIWSLNNELDYFKSEAKKLFDHNRKLRKENAQMLKKFKEYEWELENRQVIMQKLWYKYQKEKHQRGKLKTMVDEQRQNISKQADIKRKDSRPEIMEFSLKDDAFNLDEMPELKLYSNTSMKRLKNVRNPSPIEENLNESQKPYDSKQQNSLLQIDYEDESEISKIEFKGKSISIQLPKPETKDQESQVNIFLSQHSYKSLFENKKTSNKKLLKLSKPSQEIAIQTQQFQQGQFSNKCDPYLSSPKKKSREINFAKNGFYVNDVQKQTPHRSSSTNHNTTTKGESFYNFRDKKVRLTTETGFHRGQQQDSNEEDIRLVTQNNDKFHNKIYCKMAKRLERNKIVSRAYQKMNKSIEM